jgi:hypothetical protein
MRKELLVKKVVIILGLCLALIVTTAGCGGGEGTVKINAEMGVSALAALADSYIEGYVNSMEPLAMTQEVQSGQWEDMEKLLEKVDDTHIGGTVWFVLPDGSYYTVELGKTNLNLSDRDYFPGLMAGDEVLGPLVVSKSTGEASLIAAVPVVREGEVIGALGTSIFLDDLSTRLAVAIDLSDDMMFCATDDDGKVALHSDTESILEQDPVLPENVVFKTSLLMGWRFALGFKD